jgi:gamma-glutamyltranspeptidase / glutathione hydrolase
MTTSVNTNFGSLVYSPSTGMVFSNTMDDFSKPGVPNHYGLRPAESNYIMPGKRPLSSMSPTLVFRERSTDETVDTNNDLGDLVLAIGASGGPKIITSVLQVLLNYIYMGMPLLESVLHPRLHDQLLYHGSSVTAAEHAELTVLPPTTTPNKDGMVLANTSLVQSVLLDVSPRTRAALAARGHRLLDIDFSGTVQAIAVDLETRTLTAVSDPRKGGSPAGY